MSYDRKSADRRSLQVSPSAVLGFAKNTAYPVTGRLPLTDAHCETAVIRFAEICK